MKIVATALLLVGFIGSAHAQTRYIDRGGSASFFSSAPLEDIKAETNQAVSVIDLSTGELAASVLMKSFKFRKALMQEHFNENYVESDKYPKATFKGKVMNLHDLDLTKDGKYILEVSGEITLHGVTRPLNVKAEATVENGNLATKAVFPLRVADFDIEVPRLVRDNIAKEMEVTVSFSYRPLNP
jgi:polyisoprenoid-binding protein YceI